VCAEANPKKVKRNERPKKEDGAKRASQERAGNAIEGKAIVGSGKPNTRNESHARGIIAVRKGKWWEERRDKEWRMGA
jgi:hypothetical protein